MRFGLKWWMTAQKASPSWKKSTLTILLIIFIITFFINVVTLIITIMLTLQQVDMSVMVTVG